MNWLLKYNGVEKPIAEWGVSDVECELVSQDTDTVHFTVSAAYDAATVFPWKSKIILSKQDDAGNKTVWFVGWVTSLPVSATGERESQDYTLSGPWWWLTQLVYQRQWNQANDPSNPASTVAYTNRSHCLLNQGVNGTKIPTDQQITDIIQYAMDTAVAQGIAPPFQNGTGYPSVSIPIDEVLDLSCAECLRKQFRFMPEAVVWFDYTTSLNGEPTPTMNVKRRGGFTPVTLDVATQVVGNVRLTPRPDLKVPVVVFKFEQTNTVGGNSWLYHIVNTYPVPVPDDEAHRLAAERVFGALVATINLSGWSLGYATSNLKTVLWNPTQLAWLKTKFSWLNNDNVDPNSVIATPKKLIYPNGQVFLYPNSGVPPALLRELVEGTFAPGFVLANGTPVKVQEYTLVMDISYDVKDGNADPSKFTDQACSTKFVATNAVDGKYSAIQSWETGDPIPQGMAQSFYDGLSTLQYDGSIMVKRQEVTEEITLGNTLNLSGSKAEFASMNAIIQSVRWSLDGGEKPLTVGPARQISTGDFIALLRVNRERRAWTAPQTVDTGKASASNTLLPDQAGHSDSGAGGGGVSKLTFSGDIESPRGFVDGPQGRLNLRAPNTVGPISAGSEIDVKLVDCNGKKLTVREIPYCDAGLQRKILVVCSQPYD